MKRYNFEVKNTIYEIMATDYSEAVIRLIFALQRIKEIEYLPGTKYDFKVFNQHYQINSPNYIEAIRQLIKVLLKEKIIVSFINYNINFNARNVKLIRDENLIRFIPKINATIYEDNIEKEKAEEEYNKYFGDSTDAIKKLEEMVKDEELEEELKNGD